MPQQAIRPPTASDLIAGTPHFFTWDVDPIGQSLVITLSMVMVQEEDDRSSQQGFAEEYPARKATCSGPQATPAVVTQR